jgi:hypothetical protein
MEIQSLIKQMMGDKTKWHNSITKDHTFACQRAWINCFGWYQIATLRPLCSLGWRASAQWYQRSHGVVNSTTAQILIENATIDFSNVNYEISIYSIIDDKVLGRAATATYLNKDIWRVCVSSAAHFQSVQSRLR